jgi:hypothetical protein
VDSLVEALALDAEMLSGACLIEHYEAWLADVVHPAGKRSLQAAARIAALEARVNRTMQDHGRMLWRDDVEAHCPNPGLCFEKAGSTVRCSPCANRQADAAGVETLNAGRPYSPQECRMKREIAALEAENARSVEEMSEDDIAELLAKECAPYATRKASTGLSAWCIAKGVNRAHANEFVNRKRGPQADLLSALGIRCFFARALLERQTDG